MRLFVVALYMVLISACSNGIGDAIGFVNRKGDDGRSRNYSDNPEEIATTRLLNAVCFKITECHKPGPAYCDADLMQTTTIDTEIGLPAGVYSNYSAIMAADFSMDIQEDALALNACVTEVRDLDCEHPSVVNAYQHNQASKYAGVAGIFTPVCEQVF